jgi:hypothetical protein
LWRETSPSFAGADDVSRLSDAELQQEMAELDKRLLKHAEPIVRMVWSAGTEAGRSPRWCERVSAKS